MSEPIVYVSTEQSTIICTDRLDFHLDLDKELWKWEEIHARNFGFGFQDSIQAAD